MNVVVVGFLDGCGRADWIYNFEENAGRTLASSGNRQPNRTIPIYNIVMTMM